MSALPQKKMCWNCEGNVDRNQDNCSYCGVYLHPTGEDVPFAKKSEPKTSLSDPQKDSQHTSEIPEKVVSPQILDRDFQLANLTDLFGYLKKELFPLLFLMLGSVFFLFGAVLFLFSQDGVLTLQWKEESAVYFLLFSIPLIIFGWIFLQRLNDN